jgi:L-glyceraldehyde 3-phosphate reductase
MALAWVLRNPVVTSALIGASTPQQVEENVGLLSRPTFEAAELRAVDEILAA